MLKLDQVKKGFSHRYPNPFITIDSHTQGEPTRLLIGGINELPGSTIKEKKDFFASRYDHLRQLLTQEPRGHRDMFAAVVTEPVSPEAQFGLIYMDARRYPYLCGHATIGAVTTLIETGVIEAEDGDTIITVDTPSGPLQTHTRVENGRVLSVGIDMVPSFVFKTDCHLEVAGFGQVTVDIVCVGGFFAMVSAASVGIELTRENSQKLISLGMAIIDAANRELKVYHPQRPEVNTIDVTEFYAENSEGGEGSSVVVYGESHMDRSPCGTGTTAKMTLLHHQGRLSLGQTYRNASLLGTVFEGRIMRELTIGKFSGIMGQVRGSATITGYHQFVLDQNDPFQQGFLL
ncbi:MAG: proline racemase [Desulforhopalus sp.]|jgi:proline racemase